MDLSTEINDLSKDLKDFMAGSSKQSIVDKLKEMEKLKQQYTKKKATYDKAIKKLKVQENKTKDAK